MGCLVNIFIYLILFFFVCGLFVWNLPFFKISLYFFEWHFFCLKFNFYFNSLLFSFILFVVTIRVLFFSTYYLAIELRFRYYLFVLLLFVGRIFSLIFSNNIFSMLLSWDLLGISSYFLVLFYNNWDRRSGSINTALTNRLGDYFIFVFFGFSFFSSIFFTGFSFFIYYCVFFLILTSFTKRAQFPFSSWLPKAMRAPTPVSSLVHSRTLVTAGLVLLMNFKFLLNSFFLISVVLITGVFTIFFSSVSALLEEDIKKVVALSTLSQMGFSIITLGLGLYFVSFIHLIRHALFKSCLFIQIGYVIHCSFGQQDGRNYSNNGNFPYFIQLQLFLTLLCLCGIVFSSGAVRKDFILELFFFNNYSFIFCLLFFFSVFLTFGYRFRLWKNFFILFERSINHYSGSLIINFLSLFLVFLSVCFIWWLNFNIILLPRFFAFVDILRPVFFIFLFCFFCVLVWKFLIKEVVYKFLVDFFASFFIFKVKNLKFLDTMLNSYINIGFSFFWFIGFFFNNFFKNINFSSVVVILFIFFLFICGFSLIKILILHIKDNIHGLF